MVEYAVIAKLVLRIKSIGTEVNLARESSIGDQLSNDDKTWLGSTFVSKVLNG